MSKLSTYKDFIRRYLSRIGSDEIVREDEMNLRQSFNSHLRYGKLAGQWPEYLVIEERALDTDGIIPVSESGKSDIDEVFGVFAKNPLLYPTQESVKVTPVSGGWYPTSTGYDKLWVKYVAVESDFEGDDYSASTSYTTGSVVFYLSDFYEAIAPTTGNSPIDVNYWVKKTFSKRLLNYLAQACFADYYGKDDTNIWDGEMRKARALLGDEQFILGRNNQSLSPSFRTNNNQQSRR
jgi:hypothetical protein